MVRSLPATVKSPPETGAEIIRQKKESGSAIFKKLDNASPNCYLKPRFCPDLSIKANIFGTLTFLTKSFSSICPRSSPAACAMRFPATRFQPSQKQAYTCKLRAKIKSQEMRPSNVAPSPTSISRPTKADSNVHSTTLTEHPSRHRDTEQTRLACILVGKATNTCTQINNVSGRSARKQDYGRDGLCMGRRRDWVQSRVFTLRRYWLVALVPIDE